MSGFVLNILVMVCVFLNLEQKLFLFYKQGGKYLKIMLRLQDALST